MMIKNQNGSALLLVLLLAVILALISLTLMANIVNDKKHTLARESDFISIHEAKNALEEGIALIKTTFVDDYDYDDDYVVDDIRTVSPTQHDTYVQTFINRFTKNSGQYTFDGNPSLFYIEEDISFKVEKTYDFSRKFVITSKAVDENGRSREFTQDVYLSAIPSFLYYGVGTQGKLYLNGAPRIEGDVYVKVNLLTSNVAKYKFIDSDIDHLDFTTDKPYISSGSIIFADTSSSIVEPLDLATNSTAEPIERVNENTFINVDILATFADKINEKLNIFSQITPDDLSEPNLEQTISDLDISENFSIWDEEAAADHTLPESISSIFIGEDEHGVKRNLQIGDKGNLIIPENQWLVVNGDLIIYPTPGDESLEISGNLLVTGDVEIHGTVKFDSTIISLGNVLVNNAKIEKIQENDTLVLITQGNLVISRIKEFEDTANELNAFFYTDSSATLYGIGSNYKINGGVFAKGDLILNAINALPNTITNKDILNPTTNPNPTSYANYDYSRLFIKQNRKIITDQSTYYQTKSYSGLPRTDKLSIIIDRQKIQ